MPISPKVIAINDMSILVFWEYKIRYENMVNAIKKCGVSFIKTHTASISD